MSLLELLISVIGFIFLLFTIDLFQRKKFNFLHFLVFFSGTASVVVFAMRPDILNDFGSFFGVARGADLLVYIAIIFLAYLYFELLNKQVKLSAETTRLVSSSAILHAQDDPYVIKKLEKDHLANEGVTFLIRAYNEEKTIKSVIESVIEAGYSSIIVCNDGSKDSTGEIIKDLQSKYSDRSTIILLHHAINRGGGAANKTLFSFASKNLNKLKSKRFVTFDADGQMNVCDLKQFLNVGVKGDGSKGEGSKGEYDILLGSRFIQGGTAKNITWIRKIILRGSKFITLLFNKLWVTDPHNGFRLISSRVISNITIESDGMIYASEIINEIKRLQLHWTEVPVNIRYTEYSLGKGQSNGNARIILKGLVYRAFFYK